jgi:hypothetical protein
MKRRSFIKFLAAALLSPFIPSRSRSSEKAIRDPARKTWEEERFAENHVLYPDTIILDQRRRPWQKRDEHSHLHDSLQYALMDHEYYAGSRWIKIQQAQTKLNRLRSLIVNRIK